MPRSRTGETGPPGFSGVFLSYRTLYAQWLQQAEVDIGNQKFKVTPLYESANY